VYFWLTPHQASAIKPNQGRRDKEIIKQNNGELRHFLSSHCLSPYRIVSPNRKGPEMMTVKTEFSISINSHLLRLYAHICICYGLFVCAACKYAYRFVSISMLFQSRNCIQKKTKCRILMLFIDQHFPMVHLFCCKSNIMYRKWIKLFTETMLAFNLHFQHIP
jgi:hypothetical protein